MTAEDLRKSILQQAIQGKLVPQDPNDEPASVLLERIREEKARLVKEKKIKKDKNESIIYRGEDNSHYEKIHATGEVKCIDDEIPFEIPNTWEWVSLGTLLQIQTGASFKKEETKNNQIGVRILRGGNILPNKYTFKDDDIFIDKQLVSENILLKKDDLITPAVTSIENVGKMARILQNYDNVSAGGFVFILRLFVKFSTTAQYLCYAIQAPVITEKIKSITKKSGSAFYNIGKERLSAIKIPLPPLNEQKRISLKIEESLPLIEKYRVVQEQAERMDKSLNGLLKKSVLQYAIQGKLVPQIECEEPASILLEKIQQEKLRLVNEGKLKKKDLENSVIFKGEDNKYFEKKGNEVVCIDDEIPFEIPDSWEWVRMGYVGNWGAGSTPNRANHEYYNNGEILWLKTGELNDDIVYDTTEKITQKAFDECSLRLNKVGDVLIAMYGATIGKIAIVGKELTTNQACCGCSPYNGLYNRYLFYYLIANKNTFIKQGEGGAQPNISRDKLVKFLMPLPPLQEQKRIVMALDNVLASIMRN